MEYLSSVPDTPFVGTMTESSQTLTEPNPGSIYNTLNKEKEIEYVVTPETVTTEHESFTEQIPDRDLFFQYFKAWRQEREFLSSLTEIENCPSHIDIIKMGHSALPFIFEELTRSGAKPDFWFLTLQRITKHNPVPKEYGGDLKKICDSWIEWLLNNQK